MRNPLHPTLLSPLLIHLQSRTFVQDTGRKLIEVLDNVEHKKWRVDLIEDPQYLILQSVETIDHQEKPAVQLWIQRNPFKITAIRAVDAWQPTLQLPKPQNPLTSSNQLIKEIEGSKKAIIWETEDRGFKYAGNAAVLSVKKSITAKYIGFGEQGGRHFFKENTYMNYFSKFQINIFTLMAISFTNSTRL